MIMTAYTDRQNQIIQESIQLIAQKGIQGLTIKNISKAIGFSEPAIYRHFENKNDIYVFHAGSKFQKEEIATSGGRVLGMTAWAENIKEAKRKAYEGMEKIYFEDIYYRKDIAQKAIK